MDMNVWILLNDRDLVYNLGSINPFSGSISRKHFHKYILYYD